MKKLKVSVQGVEWSDDTSRVPRPCKKCGEETTGRVIREARCMKCTMSYALSPLAELVTLLRRNAEKPK